jgi:polysaccharide export outer membrane protein
MVDLDKLIEEGQSELNIEINGGDVIYVPEAGVFFVDGAVRRPGSFPIRHKTTVMEALQTAGGFRPYANTKEVYLVRFISSGKREIKKIDLAEPNRAEIEVRDRDVIFANASAWGQFKYGAGISLGIPGIMTIGYKYPGN